MENAVLGKEIEDRYIITSVLGSGGMGSVYLAKDLKQGNKEVALKLIRQELCGDAKMRRRFVKESQVFSYLNHPNIVQVEHFGQTADGQLFMAMEYIRSISLQAIRDLVLPFNLIVDLAKQLLDALAHSHIRGIIHRDLKPANILLSPLSNGSVFLKLVDFGIASLPSFAQSSEEFTRTVLGTPYYMAPEQSRGNISQIGPGTDIYSVGVMLFELLSGKLPYKGAVDIETILMHIEEPIPELKLRSEVSAPKEVCDIVRKCLAKKTWDRYVGASELSKALQALKYDKKQSYDSIREELKSRISASEQGRVASEASANSSPQGPLSKPISIGPKSVELPAREHSNDFAPVGATSASASISSDYGSNRSYDLDSDSHPSLRSSLAQNTDLLGRDIELSQIDSSCLNAVESRPNMMIIEGDWGVGKSSLMRAGVKKYVDANIVRYYSTMFSASDESYSLPAMIECILDSRNVETKSLVEFLLFKFSKLRFTQGADAETFIQFLRPSDNESPKPSTAVYQTIIDVIAASSNEMPLVIALDDIHFADDFELGFIEAFATASQSRAMRCLLLCSLNSREATLHPNVLRTLKKLTRFEGGRLRTIRLMPLPDHLMLKLFMQYYRIEQAAATLFVQYACGNPLLAREGIHMFLEERRLTCTADGIYAIAEGRGPSLNTPPLIKEIYLSYLKRVRDYLSASHEAAIIDDIVLRLAILGPSVEDALMEALFEKEGKAEFLDVLDEVIEDLIKVDFLTEISTKQGKTALQFYNHYMVKSIISEHSMRRLRPLHKLAIAVKLDYYRSMDMRTSISLMEHFEAIGAVDEALLMKYKIFKKACKEDSLYQIMYYGMQLYHVFSEKFMKIGAGGDSISYEDLREPIDWPFVLEQLGRSIFFMGKSLEAEQIADKLTYCGQRYNAPLLISRAQALTALYLLRHDDFEASLLSLQSSNEIASQREEGFEIVMNNQVTKIIVLVLQGLLSDLRASLVETKALCQSLLESPNEQAQKAVPGILALCTLFEVVDELFTFRFEESANHILAAKNTLVLHKLNFFAGLCDKVHCIYSQWTNQLPLTASNFEILKETISSYNSLLFAGYPEILATYFYLSKDLFTETIELVDKAEKLFRNTNTQVGLAFCVYVRALVALRQFDTKLCLSYLTQAVKLAMGKNYFVLANSLLTATVCATHNSDKQRIALYLKNSVAVFQRACPDYLFLESSLAILHMLSHGPDDDFFDKVDAFFAKPYARYNFFFSVGAIAMVAAALKKDMARVLRYYAEVVKTTLGAYDFFLVNRAFPGGFKLVIDFIDEARSSEINVVAMRAGILKLLERESILAVPTDISTQFNFDEFDSALDDIDKMLQRSSTP